MSITQEQTDAILAARDTAIAALADLDLPSAITALQYVTASYAAYVAKVTQRSEVAYVHQLANRTLELLNSPDRDAVVVPVIRP